MTEPRRTFTAHLRVRFGETDAMGVANNAAYLQYFEIGRIEFLRAHGRSYAEVHDGGIDMVVVEADIRYLQPLRFAPCRRQHASSPGARKSSEVVFAAGRGRRLRFGVPGERRCDLGPDAAG